MTNQEPKGFKKLKSIAKTAFADLADQSSAFGRLALLHIAMTIGDTLVTVSLAGSLFFSISPKAAQGKVILYLLLTMAPFVAVARILGPILDRGKTVRRTTVFLSAIARAALAFLMALYLNSILLFPLAFLLLVFSKVYVITKGAIVESTVTPEDDLATQNARLNFLASLAGVAGSLPAGAIYELVGSKWVLFLDVFVYAICAVLSLRLKRFKTPQLESSENIVSGEFAPDLTKSQNKDNSGILQSSQAVLALYAMSILRGVVGFLTFLLAFSLRRTNQPLYLYGLLVGASAVGSLLGSASVSIFRKYLSEKTIISSVMIILALFSGIVAAEFSYYLAALLTFVFGLLLSVARPALDSIVQTEISPLNQGRAYSRLETQLQFVWVLGAIIPVIINLPAKPGVVVVAIALGIGFFSYFTSATILRRATNQ